MLGLPVDKDNCALERIDLKVPFKEKDQARAGGARFDGDAKVWFIPAGTKVEPLMKWVTSFPELASGKKEGQSSLFDGLVDHEPPPKQSLKEDGTSEDKGIPLSELMGRVKTAISRSFSSAVWVRAELSEVRIRNGHVYLSLVEHNDRGQVIAKTSGVIWAKDAQRIQSTFKQTTGSEICAGIKILASCRIEYHPQFGLSLYINDIDPSFTVGDMQAKVQQIIDALTKDGVINKNKALTEPPDFTRLAVISPQGAAGLGDFRKDADKLDCMRLCTFDFYDAVFQGPKAPEEVSSAINNVIVNHAQNPYDALIIIRGGGATTDLAWLNDLSIAQAICNCHIPVYTGIGHERDRTVLDEVSKRMFGTPSMVIDHVRTTIYNNATNAHNSYVSIRTLTSRALDVKAKEIHAFYTSTLDLAKTTLEKVEQRAANDIEAVKTLAPLKLEKQASICAADWKEVQQVASIALNEAEKKSAMLWTEIVKQADGTLRVKEQEASALIKQVYDEAKRIPDRVEAASQQLMMEIVGLGPQRTLQRGFAIVRDKEGRPVTSSQIITDNQELDVQFHDGHTSVVAKNNGGTND